MILHLSIWADRNIFVSRLQFDNTLLRSIIEVNNNIALVFRIIIPVKLKIV